MTFMEMELARESTRAYDPDRPVSRENLVRIVEAGRLTPSGCNAQPWKFIVIDEAEARAKLCDALVVENGMCGVPFRDQVPAFIILVELPAKIASAVLQHYGDSQRFAPGDIGMAALNMSYEALELGLSTCFLGMNDQKKMEEYFGIPEGYQARLVMAVGYPAKEEPPRKKIRKPFEEACSFNRW